ncbi:ankyrin repeat-containing domain protein [Neocallimastix lanati (nom. inval.)]|nr:ankyrin repeat-containing domain protein [Neocallimastix sp. JGI-2020a]
MCIIKYLFEHGANINKENISCYSGNEVLVKYLVELETNINKELGYSKTALFSACYSGNEALVKYLVEHGTDINKESKDGSSPLLKPCSNGNEAIYILELPLNIKGKSDRYNKYYVGNNSIKQLYIYSVIHCRIKLRNSLILYPNHSNGLKSVFSDFIINYTMIISYKSFIINYAMIISFRHHYSLKFEVA